MEDPKTTPFSLPPGCRFYPSEEQIFCHYLSGKHASSGAAAAGGGDKTCCFGLIGELELYGYDPFELPYSACYSYGTGGKKRHWFCYCGGAPKESRGRRRAKNGYWRRQGRTKEVMGRGGTVVLGTRTGYAFYLGNSIKKAVRTDWVLYEYAPVDDPKAPFVLCRIFVKSRPKNSLSENGLVSCAEESVSVVRHIGTQYDGFITPEISDNAVQGDDDFCRKDNLSRHLDNEVDDGIATKPAPISSIQFPVYIQPNAQVTSSVANSCATDINTFTAEHLLAILNDDFLELDDLVD